MLEAERQPELQQIDGCPTHVAIIMDGNGRWARQRGLDRIEGHKNGVSSVLKAIEFAAKSGIKYLTLYTFSTENWSRPDSEVCSLMDLLVASIKYFKVGRS